MIYILNINENDKYNLSNISLNKKLLFKIKIKNNNFHESINNNFKKNNFNIKLIKAISFNNGPCLSYIKIRSLLSAIKGFCYILNIPLLISNDYLIIKNNKFKIFKKKKIYLIIIKKKKFFKNYLIKKNNNIKNNKSIYLIKNKYKKYIKRNFKKKKLFLYNINYKNIINYSYKEYKKKNFIKNINLCEPIYIK
ncbi:MAG: hypothetical protein NHF95_00615 [Candidatus Shikimatogenerans sp. JK-2022]|nr:hypothetical protein [Candidatus Shikimatogenerans bostrichidophilus]